jgi:hypothetical protein
MRFPPEWLCDDNVAKFLVALGKYLFIVFVKICRQKIWLEAPPQESGARGAQLYGKIDLRSQHSGFQTFMAANQPYDYEVGERAQDKPTFPSSGWVFFERGYGRNVVSHVRQYR